MTVGSGISPDLLTPVSWWTPGARGLATLHGLPPVGNCTPP